MEGKGKHGSEDSNIGSFLTMELVRQECNEKNASHANTGNVNRHAEISKRNEPASRTCAVRISISSKPAGLLG